LSAQVIQLAEVLRLRGEPARAPVAPDEVARLPLVVQAHQGAVALYLPDVDFWLSPKQARDVAADLIRAAEDAEREGADRG
jgi:hypothetical protein